jgi:hypothetical protein
MIKKTPHTRGLAPMCMPYFMGIVVKIRVRTIIIEVISTETNSLYGTNIETQFSHIICTELICSFLTSAAIVGVQVREMSKLGWLIETFRQIPRISCRWRLIQSARPLLPVEEVLRVVRNRLTTLRVDDANLRLCISTAGDQWLKSAFLVHALFPRTIHRCFESLRFSLLHDTAQTLLDTMVSNCWRFHIIKIIRKFYMNF